MVKCVFFCVLFFVKLTIPSSTRQQSLAKDTPEKRFNARMLKAIDDPQRDNDSNLHDLIALKNKSSQIPDMVASYLFNSVINPNVSTEQNADALLSHETASQTEQELKYLGLNSNLVQNSKDKIMHGVVNLGTPNPLSALPIAKSMGWLIKNCRTKVVNHSIYMVDGLTNVHIRHETICDLLSPNVQNSN